MVEKYKKEMKETENRKSKIKPFDTNKESASWNSLNFTKKNDNNSDEKKYIILKPEINGSPYNPRRILLEAKPEYSEELREKIFALNKQRLSSVKIIPRYVKSFDLMLPPYYRIRSLTLDTPCREPSIDFHTPQLIPKKISKRKLKKRVAAFKRKHRMFDFIEFNWKKFLLN